jgi:hypothetical protein
MVTKRHLWRGRNFPKCQTDSERVLSHARVRIGKTEFQTSLFPKDDRYLVPIKASVRKAENLGEGDRVTVRLEVG